MGGSEDTAQESPDQDPSPRTFPSLVTYNFPRQLHSLYPISLLVFGDTCTRVVLNPGLSSSELRPLVSVSLSTVVAVSMCALHSCLRHS